MPTVRRVPTADLTAAELAAIRDLLDTAFAGDDDGFGDDDWEHALGGTHAVVEADGRIVSHASVVPRALTVDGRDLRTGYVEAVATHPDAERQGFGSMAMRVINEVIREDYELGALGTGALEFYGRLGWEVWRGTTWVNSPAGPRRTDEEDGAILILRTPRTGSIDLEAAIACDWREGDVW